MSYRVHVVALLLVGCVAPAAVDCPSGHVCPAGQLCTATGCATSEELDACTGVDDGDTCSIPGSGTVGTCVEGACESGSCGNGIVDGGEACDDSNRDSGDGCRGDCGKLERCGDAQVDANERCDDGNANPADGCSATCAPPAWIATTIVGGPRSALAVPLVTPHQLSYDPAGRLIIVDRDGQRVVRRELDGSAIILAGSGVRGFAGDGGDATAAQLADPTGAAVDNLGRLVIADTNNHRIRRVETDGRIVTLAGDGVAGFRDEIGPAVLARVAAPSAVVIDLQGAIVFADHENNRIRRISPTGTISTVANLATRPIGIAVDAMGRFVVTATDLRVRRMDADGSNLVVIANAIGAPGAGGDGGPATSAQLINPAQIAVGPTGDIFIADRFGARVRRISNGTISTFAGTGVFGSAGDGGPATAATVSPSGVAVAPTGEVSIADDNGHAVRQISGGTIARYAGTGVPFAAGDGVAATSTRITVTSSAASTVPTGLAIDPQGRVVFTDGATARVRRIELDGTISTIATNLDLPTGLAFDSQGRLYIGEYDGDILRIDASGARSTFLARDGAYQKLADLAIDASDTVYFANHDPMEGKRIYKVAPGGTPVHFAGAVPSSQLGDFLITSFVEPTGLAIDPTSGALLIADRGAGTIVSITGSTATIVAAGLMTPVDVAVGASGRIVAVETDDHRVVELAGGVATAIAGRGENRFDGDGGPAAGAAVQYPIGVAIHADGRIVFADGPGDVERLREISAGATPQIASIAGALQPESFGPIGSAFVVGAQAIAAGRAGELFVASGATGVVGRVVDGRVTAVAGRYPQASATLELAAFGDREHGAVGGVAFDATSSTIYATERDRVRAIAAGDPDPRAWMISDDTMRSFGLSAPTGLAFDPPTRTLYIADTGHHAIRAFAIATGASTLLANTRQTFGFAGDGGPATAALLFAPAGIARCANGDVFIADAGNHRVRRIDVTGTITTVLGDGNPVSSGAEGAPSRSFPVDTPSGIACDPYGNVAVTSRTVIRVLAADPASGLVDGAGAVYTIFGQVPRDEFPVSTANCLTGLVALGDRFAVTDACSGLVVELARAP